MKEVISAVLKRFSENKITKAKALELLLTEMGRGGVSLMVDENTSGAALSSNSSKMRVPGLADILRGRGYTTDTLKKGVKDEAILASGVIRNKVLITRNGIHFDKFRHSHEFALIWVEDLDNKRLSSAIEKALMKYNFGLNSRQCVVITFDKGRNKFLYQLHA